MGTFYSKMNPMSEVDKSNYKTIIFDFGGVVGSNSDTWEDEYHKIVELTGLSEAELHEIYDRHFPKLAVGAELASVFWDEVYEKSKNKLVRGILEKYYEEGVRADKEVLRLAQELKEKGFKTAVITNTAVDWVDIKMRKFGLKEIFSGVYCSCTVGIAKPDPQIYLTTIKNLNTSPRESVFIDDRQENLDASEKLGIKGVLFTNASKLREDLGELLGIEL
jgi:epoxide hydrolase-like predicted phosphatase